MSKKANHARDIVARSVTLTDSRGKARIYLGVLDGAGRPHQGDSLILSPPARCGWSRRDTAAVRGDA